MDTRRINEEYAKIGQELIETEEALEELRYSEATIIYLSSNHEKTDNGRIVHGQAEKIPIKYGNLSFSVVEQ